MLCYFRKLHFSTSSLPPLCWIFFLSLFWLFFHCAGSVVLLHNHCLGVKKTGHQSATGTLITKMLNAAGEPGVQSQREPEPGVGGFPEEAAAGALRGRHPSQTWRMKRSQLRKDKWKHEFSQRAQPRCRSRVGWSLARWRNSEEPWSRPWRSRRRGSRRKPWGEEGHR